MIRSEIEKKRYQLYYEISDAIKVTISPSLWHKANRGLTYIYQDIKGVRE